MDNLPNQSQLDLLLILVLSLVGLFFIYYLINYYWSNILNCCCNKERRNGRNQTCLRNGQSRSGEEGKDLNDFLLNGSTYKRFTELDQDEEEEIVIWNNLNSKLEKERKEREINQV